MNFLNFFSVKLCRLKILQFFVKSKWRNISIIYSLFVKAAMKTVISTMGDLNVRFVLHMNYVPIARKKVFTTITNWSKMFRGMFVYFFAICLQFFFLIFKIFSVKLQVWLSKFDKIWSTLWWRNEMGTYIVLFCCCLFTFYFLISKYIFPSNCRW